MSDVIDSPLVSVIVTTFNRVHYLAETVDSILAQRFENFELIIVDNMSEDGTEEYVSKIDDPRVSYYRNLNHGVIAVNRNFGVERAKGKYIALCDDDDLWLPEKLQLQVMLMEDNPSIGLCHTNAESFAEGQTLKSKMVRRNIRRNHFKALLSGNYIINSSVLIRTVIFRKLGALTTDSNLREDYHMWLRIAKSFEIEGVDQSLVRYRVHISNVAGNRASETLRSIRTVRSVVKMRGVPWLTLRLNVAFQYFKYIYYCLVYIKTSIMKLLGMRR